MTKPIVPHSSNLPSSHPSEACCVEQRDLVAEQIFDPSTGKCEFIVRHRDGKICHEAHVVLASGERVVPIDDHFIRSGAVSLPRGIEDRGGLPELEQAVVAHVSRFVHLNDDQMSVVAAFIPHTWQFPRFDTAPFLHLLGQGGSGKTRLLRVLRDLCYRSISVSGGSSHSSLFRSVDLYRGTLCLDETDFSARNGEDFEIARALRGSFQRGFVYTRTQGGHDNWAPVSFDLFGPKVIAGLHPFSDLPLESRCVQIVMRSGVRPDLYPVSLPADYEEQSAGLRGWLLGWRLKSYFEPLEARTLPDLDGRLQQVFGPLLSVLQSPKLRSSLEAVAGRAQAELREARSESPDGAILAAMVRLASQAGRLPAKIYLQGIVGEISLSLESAEGPAPTARIVSSFCQQLGMLPTKDGKGRWVLFDPAAHLPVLEQFGLAWEPGRDGEAA